MLKKLQDGAFIFM